MLVEQVHQAVQLTAKQLILVHVMGIKCGAAHICMVNNIFDGDIVISLFHHQRYQGVTERLTGALTSTVIFPNHEILQSLTTLRFCPLMDIPTVLQIDSCSCLQ